MNCVVETDVNVIASDWDLAGRSTKCCENPRPVPVATRSLHCGSVVLELNFAVMD